MALGDNYQVRKFTTARLKEVAAAWEAFAGAEEFEIELSTVFELAETHIETDVDGYALELYNSTKDSTEAILEVANGKWGSMTKLLKMFISPEFWPVNGEYEFRGDVLHVHAAAYASFIISGLASGVNEVKIYGRTNVMLGMLNALEKVWPEHNTGSVAKMQGRWLNISRHP